MKRKVKSKKLARSLACSINKKENEKSVQVRISASEIGDR